MIALADGFYRDARAHARSTARSTRWATPRAARSTSTCCRAYLLDHGQGLGDEFRSGSSRTRCASSTRKVEDWQDVHRARAAAHRVPQRRVGRALRACAGGSATRSASSYEIDASARARLRLLHEHHVRVPAATRSTRRRTRSAAAGATTGSPRRWAARRRRASGSASGSSDCCIACDAEGVLRAQRRRASTCSSSTASVGEATERRVRRGRAARGRACAPTARTATGR